MLTIERTADGRFAAQSFYEKYPTGRKHCGQCRCWRHTVDFSVAKWIDVAKTIPFKLVSYCRCCVAALQRRRKGYGRRRVFDGQVGTEAWHQRRLAKKRVRYYENRKDPKWVQVRRDYFNRRNRLLAYARWGYHVDVPPPDPAMHSGAGKFSALKFLEYVEKFITEIETQAPSGSKNKTFFLNGIRMGDFDARQIRRFRDGATKTVMLKTADEWSLKYDLPFWEIEEAAMIAA